MPLDPSIFMQGAQLKAQRDAQLSATLGGVANNYVAAKQKKEENAAKGFEIDKLYETAVLKDQMGLPVSDLERAGFQAFQKVQQSKLSIDPLTGEPYSPYQPFSLGGQAAQSGIPKGVNSILPQSAGLDMNALAPPSGPVVKGGPVALDFSDIGGAPMLAASDLGAYSPAVPSPGKPPAGLNIGALGPLPVSAEVPAMQPRNRREAFDMRKMEMERAGRAQEEATKAKNPREYSDAQAKAAGFASRMVGSKDILSTLPPGAEKAKTGKAGLAEAVLGGVPSLGLGDRIGEGVLKMSSSPEKQQYLNAAQEWIRAKLRKESGAVIGDDEMRKEYATYFPTFGDSEKVIAQKAKLRTQAEKAMVNESAGLFGVQYGQEPQGATSIKSKYGLE